MPPVYILRALDLFKPSSVKMLTLPVDKAAALFHAIIRDHAFVDGNKRTATVASVLLLNAMKPLAGSPSTLQFRFLGELAVETAEGHVDASEAAHWFRRILELE